MKKIGIFLDEIKDKTIDEPQKFAKLGFNTGNLLFWQALKEQLNLSVLSRWYIDNGDELDLSQYKAFVTTDLIWIRQNQDFSYLNKVIDLLGDIPLVPISIGLQCNDYKTDFEIHLETVNVIKRISEKCVMGVRGYYTAEILNKHGIDNFKVIGCPSVYNIKSPVRHSGNFHGKTDNVSVNFETFYRKLDKPRFDFLTYCKESNFAFVEQTESEINEEIIGNNTIFRDMKEYLSKRKRIFFDADEWSRYFDGIDFSMGMRFHGNVMALWKGVPALFMVGDSRTRELCEFFGLPHIGIEEFDGGLGIEKYYEMANYGEFNGKLEERGENWMEFLKINQIDKE